VRPNQLTGPGKSHEPWSYLPKDTKLRESLSGFYPELPLKYVAPGPVSFAMLAREEIRFSFESNIIGEIESEPAA
jgi:hypothetical protein